MKHSSLKTAVDPESIERREERGGWREGERRGGKEGEGGEEAKRKRGDGRGGKGESKKEERGREVRKERKRGDTV